ncbi:MAG: hypothetical protein V9E87_15610 [Gemmatimonadales bacterium]
MAAMVEWLAGLPPVAIYAVIALLAAVENIFPPFPADTAIALGAFLSYRGIIDARIIFAITLVANVGGAMGMYWLAARHSATLFESGFAKRFLPEQGLAFVRKEYQRFGLLGLFIGRLLPGFRAVVAPFTGLIHLGPWRALVPILFASALWYGAIIVAAAKLGENWETVIGWVNQFNKVAGIVLVILIAIGAFLWWRRRKRVTP